MQRRVKLVIAGISVLVGTILATKYLVHYLSPFLLALLIAALIDPLVNVVERRLKISRGVAVLIILLLFLALVILVLTLMVTNLTAELTHLLSLLPRYSSYWEEWLNNMLLWVENLYIMLFAEIPAPIAEIVRPDLDQVIDTVRMLVGRLLGSLSRLPAFGFTLIIASIATFFISRDRRLFAEFFMSLVPKRWRPQAEHIREEVVNGIFGFLRSQLMLISLSGSLAVIGLTALRIRYAWLLGLLVAVLDFIPMTGPSGVFVPLILYQVIIGNIPYAAWLTVILGIILVTRQLAEPRIVGAQLGLHPLTSLIAVYLGAKLLGVSGFVLGPLVMVALKAFMVVIFIPAWQKE
ncbi:MAG: sporulation integral membrane protein YtvI [Firmicutes bacterium]|jgi:sporulation integral membrane protein YtvI|nr:sporulation integral membrane protein YtvI [Bacillota bacterium]